VAKLIYSIERRLAEFSNGHLTEEELHSALRPLVASYSSEPARAVETGSSSVVSRVSLSYQQSGSVHRRPEAASA
jgi:hypothetical protein